MRRNLCCVFHGITFTSEHLEHIDIVLYVLFKTCNIQFYTLSLLVNLNKRLFDHKRNILPKNTINTLVVYCNKTVHNLTKAVLIKIECNLFLKNVFY